jgi:hypothetical protein
LSEPHPVQQLGGREQQPGVARTPKLDQRVAATPAITDDAGVMLVRPCNLQNESDLERD